MVDPIRVLHLVNQLTVGGSERQMYMLLRAFDPARVRSSVGFMRQGTGELLRPLQALETAPEEYSLRGSIAQWNTLRQIHRLASRCRRDRVSLIHAHDLWSNVIGFAAARLARIPIIVSRRDMADFRPAQERRLLRLVGRFADATIANANSIADLAAGEGTARDAIHVIPNGIDVAAFDRDAERPLLAPLPERRATAKRAAVIGNMDRAHKGHGDVLVAASKLGAHEVDWLFLSDGPLRPAFERQAAELGLAERAHFIGRRQDVASILRNVDFLVHASHSEGFPNVVLEALCARLPVVATDVGGTSDLIQNRVTGLLVPPRRPDALRATITSLLSNWEDATAYGRAGRGLVEGNFNVDKAVRRFEDLYGQLVGSSASRVAAPVPRSQAA